nr:yxeJ [Bacillus subtilis]
MSLINSHQSADSGLNIWSQLFFYTIVTASEWIGGLQKRRKGKGNGEILYEIIGRILSLCFIRLSFLADIEVALVE